MRASHGLMLFLLVLVSLAASAQPASSLDKSSGGSVPALSLSKGQAYPTRPVRVLIPFTAGSAADIIARAMEPAMRERLGQPFVIDNRGGVGGNIAAEMTAKETADG